MKHKKILYYIDSAWPTDEQKSEAAKIGASFRNVLYFDRPEQCDGVMGAVPDGYPDEMILSPAVQDTEVDAPDEPKRKRGRPGKQVDAE